MACWDRRGLWNFVGKWSLLAANHANSTRPTGSAVCERLVRSRVRKGEPPIQARGRSADHDHVSVRAFRGGEGNGQTAGDDGLRPTGLSDR